MSTELASNVFSVAALKRYTKFLVVGGLNAGVDLLVLNGLMLVASPKSSLQLTGYNSIAVACAIINSYLWNRRWTFADASDGSARETVLFLVQAAINIIVNDILVVALSLQFAHWHVGDSFIQSNLAKAIAMFGSSSISFLFMTLIVFSKARARKIHGSLSDPNG